MSVVFGIQSLVEYDWFLNYNIGELADTYEVNIVPVSAAFTLVRCGVNKIYFKLLEYSSCTVLTVHVLTSHVLEHNKAYG